MTASKCFAVAGVIGLLALSSARACDDFDEEMTLAAAREASKAGRTDQAAAPEVQSGAQTAQAVAVVGAAATAVATGPQSAEQVKDAAATLR